MDLDYDPVLEQPLVDDLERAALRIGLPLERLELLGQDAAVARTFVRAADAGDADALLDEVDWEGLEIVLTRRRVAVAAWVDLLAPESTTTLIEGSR